MDAGDAMERGDRAPLLPESHGPKIPQDDSLQVPLLKDKNRAGSKAPAVVLERQKACLEEITIAWQLPQYFFMAGAEVFCYIAQLEFFYAEAPDTMKSTCTSLSLLTIALGSYMSSFI
ncbi:unnamed protein product [Miscanthus lutarioriparius]|uniref:Uncharacterized protein n=1 Tax=Miscanthus lutarioriparius TaxID=422564 RepID=A0A811PJ68_9POAL|nr:unnamed protein product [Miscanthus lutarioriparius]